MTAQWQVPFSSRRLAHLFAPKSAVQKIKEGYQHGCYPMVRTACGLLVNPALAEAVAGAPRCRRCAAAKSLTGEPDL